VVGLTRIRAYLGLLLRRDPTPPSPSPAGRVAPHPAATPTSAGAERRTRRPGAQVARCLRVVTSRETLSGRFFDIFCFGVPRNV